MGNERYRLRMSMWRRALTVGFLALLVVMFIPGLVSPDLDALWRLTSIVGIVTALLGIRNLLGAVIVVRDKGLRVQRWWPLRREVPWYRVLAVDVIPGFWNLEVELNSGERIELPCVADLEGLYRSLEAHRQALDA